MPIEIEVTGGEQEGVALAVVGMCLTTVGLLVSTEVAPGSYLHYGMMAGGVATAVTGFLMVWRANEGD